MKQPVIVPMNPDNESAFYALAEEYLPGSEPENMRRFFELYPNAFLSLMMDDQLIGVAFGWPRKYFAPEDPSFTLDGIAIKEKYWRKGYGKILLSAFVESAHSYGAPSVSVGSAGGYVEHFYMTCGFIPKEYKAWVEGKPLIEHTYRDIDDYFNYHRQNDDGFVVMEKPL